MLWLKHLLWFIVALGIYFSTNPPASNPSGQLVGFLLVWAIGNMAGIMIGRAWAKP